MRKKKDEGRGLSYHYSGAISEMVLQFVPTHQASANNGTKALSIDQCMHAMENVITDDAFLTMPDQLKQMY